MNLSHVVGVVILGVNGASILFPQYFPCQNEFFLIAEVATFSLSVVIEKQREKDLTHRYEALKQREEELKRDEEELNRRTEDLKQRPEVWNSAVAPTPIEVRNGQ